MMTLALVNDISAAVTEVSTMAGSRTRALQLVATFR
jgi:hypothetical protein